MKNTKLLAALACLGLLITGCSGNTTPSGQTSQKASEQESSAASQSPSSSKESVAPSSSKSSAAPSSSSAAPAHNHNYQQVGEAVQNADGKDVYIKECADKDDKYIGIAFDDYSEKSADFGSTSGYNNVPEELRNASRLLTKNSTITWKFNIDKAVTGAKVAFGVVYTGSDHGSQTGLDGGTVKYSIQANGGEFVDWAVGSNDTYDGLGLSQTARAYVTYATVDLVAGENSITLRQNNAGYRLLYGDEVRIHFAGDATVVAAPIPFDGYEVTFTTEHCKVFVYSGKDYASDPVETNKTIAKDETGEIVAYDPEDLLPQPQVNFKVVCDQGYSVNATNFKITGKYKNLKQNPAKTETPAVDDDSLFRITKVQEDLVVEIKAVQGEAAIGYKVNFVTTNCSVKVYVGPKNADGTNVDVAQDGVYYARAKDGNYDISFTTPQLNFEVVCDNGYEFKPSISAENKVDFITHPDTTKDGYNKFSSKGSYYNLTKVDDDLTITIVATLAGEGGGEGGEGGGETITPAKVTFTCTNCTVKVYIGAKNEAGDNVDAGPDFYTRDKTDPTQYQIGDDAQFNFEVIPNSGYKFVDGVAFDAKSEAVAANVSFISGTYNKLKLVGENLYKLTKVAGDLQITLTCVEA